VKNVVSFNLVANVTNFLRYFLYLIVVGVLACGALLSVSPAHAQEAPAPAPAPATAPQPAPAPAPAQVDSVGSSNGHSWGDYPNYYATGPTTSPFARNVYTAFMNNWVAGGGTNVTLSVYSPSTGGTYTMYCSGSSARVTCTGGKNARVVIH